MAGCVGLGLLLWYEVSPFRFWTPPRTGEEQAADENAKPKVPATPPAEVLPLPEPSEPVIDPGIAALAGDDGGGEEEGAAATADEPVAYDHLVPPLLYPADRRIVFKAGRFDGKLGSLSKASSLKEFGMVQRPEPVVTVKHGTQEETMPQAIRKGQKIVIHLGELAEENLLARSLLRTTESRDDDGRELPASLRVLFNGHEVYHCSMPLLKLNLRVLLPGKWIEAYDNTLTLINTGEKPLLFDALWVEAAQPALRTLRFGTAEDSFVPEPFRTEMPVYPRPPPRDISEFSFDADAASARKPVYNAAAEHPVSDSWRLARTPVGHLLKFLSHDRAPLREEAGIEWEYEHIRFQKRIQHLRMLMTGMVAFFQNGGTHLRMSGFADPGEMVSPVTGQLLPEGYAMRLVAQVIPRRATREMVANVTPVKECPYPLPPVHWFGTTPTDGTAALLVAGRFRERLQPRAVHVTVPLPWSGPTRVEIRNGICPKNILEALHGKGQDIATMNLDSHTIDLDVPAGPEGGLFERTFLFREVLCLRFVKAGAAYPEAEPPTAEELAGAMKRQERGIGGRPAPAKPAHGYVTLRPLPRYLNCQRGGEVPDDPNFYAVLSPKTYSLRFGAATRGQVGSVSQVVPSRPKSLFITADTAHPPAAVAEGVLIEGFNARAARELGFWVYPHAEGLKRVRLGVTVNGKHMPFALEPGRWQRVVVGIAEHDNAPLFNIDHCMFTAVKPAPEDSAERNGAVPGEITFEINGVYATGDSPAADSWRVWKDADDGRTYLAVLGPAGGKLAFRHRFPNRVRIAQMRYHCVETGNPPQMKFDEASQLLELNDIRLPGELSAEADKHLTAEEVAKCREEGLTVFVASMKIED